MKRYLFVLDYQHGVVRRYVLPKGEKDPEKWMTENTSLSLSNCHWMVTKTKEEVASDEDS